MGMVKKRAPKRKSLERVQTPASEKEKMKTLMNDLKSAVVNDLNLEAITQILSETVDHRIKLMENTRTDIKEMFPVFFAHPELVNMLYFSYGFQLILILLLSNRFYLISNNDTKRLIMMHLLKDGIQCELCWLVC